MKNSKKVETKTTLTFPSKVAAPAAQGLSQPSSEESYIEQPLVVVWPYKKSKKWYRTLVSKLICFFTNSNYTHAAIYLGGYIFESQVMNNANGAMKTKGKPPVSRGCAYLKLKRPLPVADVQLLLYNLNKKVLKRQPYNFMKLFAMAFLYPTRKFWEWIGWVPFSAEVYGEVCSVFVDTAFKEIGLDLLPGANEEITAPGDLFYSMRLAPV